LTKILVLTIAPLFGVQALPLAADGGESTEKRAIRLTKDVGGAEEPTIPDTKTGRAAGVVGSRHGRAFGAEWRSG
jgi:hypothetical protein